MAVFVRADPMRCGFVLGCLLLAAAAEGVGLSSLLPLLSFVARAAPGDTLTSSPEGKEGLERIVLQSVAYVGLDPTPRLLLVAIAVAMIVRATLVLLATREVGYTVAQVATDMRLRLVRALLRTRWRFFQGQPVGLFANTFAAEARRTSDAFLAGITMCSHLIQVVLYLTVALAASWRVAVVAMPIGLATLVLPSRLIRVSRRAGRRQTELLKQITKRLTDAFQGVKSLKAMARGDRVSLLLEEDTRQLNKTLRREVLTKEALKISQEPLLIISIATGLFVARMHYGVELATLTLLALIFTRVVTSMAKAQRQYQLLATDESAYWSMVEMIERAEADHEEPRGAPPPRLQSRIELRDVSLAFGRRTVLDRTSIVIGAGSVTALVGPSGSGKTCVADLIVGLHEPDSGEILIDGVPLRDLDIEAWRGHVGYVPQEMFLLHETIATNVSLGDPRIEASEIQRALRDAGAWGFVNATSDGVDTVVGERGSRLSGGERQRIAIARALIHHPRLLILDEATAALDPATEAELWSTIEKLRGRTTVLAISHSTGVLEIADRVYRLEAGRATEVATRSR